MLGEVALYSFIILLLTGTYLTFFFDPSEAKEVYHGRYVPLDGLPVSKAYESTLEISFDVRAGLLIRQVHHWAALLFVAAIIIHMCRIFFTGAFRKPRELNWLIGLSLLLLALIEGFCGYSLPDDLLSGTGLRIANAIMLSIPVIGTWLAFLIFGGPFPGTHVLGRLYIAHVLLIPGIIVVLIAAHLTLVVRQKHTDFPGVGRTEKTVAGERVFPIYAAKSIGLLCFVTSVVTLLGGITQINPVWLWGPYDPAKATSYAQPDWYVLFAEGALRLFPPIEFRGLGHDIPNVFWAAALLPITLFFLAAIYPFLERRLLRDRSWHNVLQRPRDNPTRTGIGAMALSFWALLTLAGTDDVIAGAFRIPLELVVWTFRVMVLVVPPLAFVIARHVCRSLQRHDRLLLAQGIGTGEVRRGTDGDWAEVTRAVEAIGSGEPEPLRYGEVLDDGRGREVSGRASAAQHRSPAEPSP